MDSIAMTPIGVVRSTRTVVADDDWDKEEVLVELDGAQFTGDALLGLDSFSHVEVLFHMNRVSAAAVETGARHPRNRPEWPRVGIFAQRGKNRPNCIGTAVCRVLRVEGTKLFVRGLDAVDGSPVLDLKPWVQEFGPRGSVTQPPWMTELMVKYWEA